MENTQNLLRNGLEFLVERRVNKSNKVLMMEKILSYSPTLENGIEKYKVENRRFTLFILSSILLVNIPVVSLSCCFIAIAFLVKMLHLIKYRSIYNIVKKMGKDIAFSGIYNKGIVEGMVEDFKIQYGEDIIEYYELVYMVKKYEAFVIKIEQLLKNTNKDKNDKKYSEKCLYKDYDTSKIVNQNYDELNGNTSLKEENKNCNSKYSLLYKNEEGEIKKVNRAIEFFDDKNKNAGAVVLKGGNKKDKKLTVYLYKKNSELQNNAL